MRVMAVVILGVPPLCLSPRAASGRKHLGAKIDSSQVGVDDGTGLSNEERALSPQSEVTRKRFHSHRMVNANDAVHAHAVRAVYERANQTLHDRSRVSPNVQSALQFLDLDKLMHARTMKEPYHHIFVERFLKPLYFEAVCRDFPPSLKKYPEMDEAILKSMQEVSGSFKELLHELRSAYLKLMFAAVLDVDLQMTTPHLTLYGYGNKEEALWSHRSQKKHVEVCAILFLSKAMPKRELAGPNQSGFAGQLRLLNSSNINSTHIEYASFGGNLVAFKPLKVHSPNGGTGYHGHTPLDGPRWAVHIDYVRSRPSQQQQLHPNLNLSAWNIGKGYSSISDPYKYGGQSQYP